MSNSALDALFAEEDFGAAPTPAPAAAEETPQAKAAPQPAAQPTAKVAATNSLTLVQQAATKLAAIERELNLLFLEREDEIKSIIVGLVSGRHVLLLGPPGTGKSAIAYEIASRITGANYFQTLLNQTSDPSEILGPYSLKELENDRFVRKPTGRLPEAHVAFLDEIK